VTKPVPLLLVVVVVAVVVVAVVVVAAVVVPPVVVEEVGLGAATVAVAADVATLEPHLFVAVTITRSVVDSSAVPSTCVFPVAPDISAQLLAFVSQLIHWYEYETPFPVQLPGLAVSVWPATAEPPIVGRELSAGAVRPAPAVALDADAIRTSGTMTAATRTEVKIPRLITAQSASHEGSWMPLLGDRP
jgi:hypothetical protein